MRFYEKIWNNKVETPYCDYYIPYDDLVLIRYIFEKLEINSDSINVMITTIKEFKGEFEGLFIFLYYDGDGEFWLNRKDVSKDDINWVRQYEEKENIEYKGEIRLEDHEIEAIKYNL